QSNLLNLAPELADIMVKAIAPKRADRFASAAELMNALAAVPAARRPPQPTTPVPPAWVAPDGGGNGMAPGNGGGVGTPIEPNTNPYVRHLLTVYSQSKRSNAGTRGLDAISEQTYVETAL